MARIQSEEQYNHLAGELDELVVHPEGSLTPEQQQRLEELTELISEYDDEHMPQWVKPKKSKMRLPKNKKKRNIRIKQMKREWSSGVALKKLFRKLGWELDKDDSSAPMQVPNGREENRANH